MLSKIGVGEDARNVVGNIVDVNSAIANQLFDQAQDKVLAQSNRVVPKKLAQLQKLDSRINKAGKMLKKAANDVAKQAKEIFDDKKDKVKDKAEEKVEDKLEDLKEAAEDAVADVATDMTVAATNAIAEGV